MRKDNIQRLKQEITNIKRSIKTAEKDIILACEIASSPDKRVPGVLTLKEKHFRSLRRKLTQMQADLTALQEGTYQPIRVEAWKVRRHEVSLITFCEA